MALQTVFITNRNINIEKNKKKQLFGDDLDKEGKIHFAVAERYDKTKVRRFNIIDQFEQTKTSKTYKLSLVEPNNVSAYLASVLDSNNDRPWVFFLHGNNQTLSKNLAKSRLIQDEYDVNMVIFSWPSSSYAPKTFLTLILGTLLTIYTPKRWFGKWFFKRVVKGKETQYKQANIYAEKTAPSFNQAFKIIRDGLLIPLKERNDPHTCFLVHSLGHYLLRKSISLGGPILDEDYKFSTCMLHQADEVDENHRDWITSISIVENENTYVTRNKKDKVLFLSGLVNNNYNLAKACTRLGNRWDRDSENGSPLKYIDFTGMNDVGLIGHGVAWDDGRSPDVNALCRPIIAGN